MQNNATRAAAWVVDEDIGCPARGKSASLQQSGSCLTNALSGK
jgi:hypothetical protein